MLKPGEIIQIQEINGKEFVFRLPQESDLKEMLDYINKLSAERTFIRIQGVQQTLEEEKKYLDELLEKMKEDKQLSILALHQDKIVAHVQVSLSKYTDQHLGEIGITVKKGYRDQGLGSYLMKLAMKEAVQKLPGLEIFRLTVYANNDRGIHLYKKLGFCEYGRLPRGIKRDDGYVDRVYMYKQV